MLAMRIPLACVMLFACSTDRHPSVAPPPSTPAPVPAPTVANPIVLKTELDPRFVETIRSVAAPYATWGRVDERPNIAPLKCDMPRPEDYGSKGDIHMSDAEDAPHGKKLYYLWASDRRAYLEVTQHAVASGFAIVKQSFVAVPAGEPKHDLGLVNTPLYDTLEVDGHWLTTGEAKGIYVMTKVGPKEGTDAGWIYGTIDPAGRVTSAGRVASCIGCHEDAPHDRLFGLKAKRRVGASRVQ